MTAQKNLVDVARDLVTQHADSLAVVSIQSDAPTQLFTYGDYFRRAAGYAACFHDAGLKPGELISLIMPSGPEVMFAFWGALLLGAVPSIFPSATEKMDINAYGSMIRAMATVSRPAMLATYPAFYATICQITEGIDGLRAIVAPEAREDDPMRWIDAYQGDDSQVAILQHSSGTTGLQKGIEFSHRAILRFLDRQSVAREMTDTDVIVSWLPLYHDMGLLQTFLLPCVNALPMVLMSPFHWVRDPKVMLWAVHTYRGTASWLPNFAFNFMATRINDDDLVGLDLSSWRLLGNGSEPVRVASHEMFIRRFAPYGLNPNALTASWGTAENVAGITFTPGGAPPHVDYVHRQHFTDQRVAEPIAPDDPLSLPQVSCGIPLPGVQLKIIDDDGKELPERSIGEVLVLNDVMFSGYHNRPDLTEEAFRDGWFITGDLGYLANGELYIVGRKKDLIIVGGKNVYPQDIEEIAGGVSGVKGGRVVAFGVFNEKIGTEDIYVVCEVSTDSADERRRIELEIRERLSRQADITARRVVLREAGWLLKSTSGKLARSANRDKYLAEVKATQ